MRSVLEKVGYERPTPVQAGMIPLVFDEFDVVGQAQTGTGKTAAFAIPILEMLEEAPKGSDPQALILVPTRELAVQVEGEIRKLATDGPFSCAAIYGGARINSQMKALNRGVDIVVGTPGRVIDHLNRGTLRTDKLWCVVLDEADRMLDIGFRPDIERILKRCPKDRQTLLLSATLPPPILMLARRYMNYPKRVDFSRKNVSATTIEQHYFSVDEAQKFSLLTKLIEREDPQQAIVFCRTKIGTERLYRKLSRQVGDKSIRAIHGDMTQSARNSVMKAFRDGSLTIMVATDVVGRGIDVSDVSHIINYDVPELSEDYVHRVGRTGRMGKTGIAFTFVTPLQASALRDIEKTINQSLQRDHFDGLTISAEEEAKRKENSRTKPRYRRAL